MRALIANNKWVYLDQVIGAYDSVLNDHFSAKHPRIQFIDTKQQSWDGWFRKYDRKNSRIARPLLNELIVLCAKHGIPLEVEDLREAPEKVIKDAKEVDPEMLRGITLEPHQLNAIKTICGEEVGMISIPTGGGKTEVAAGIIKHFNMLTVVIADQRIVIEQIKERLELRDVVEGGAGLFYGGETPNGQMVVVGSIQSMTSPPLSLKKKNFNQWKSRVRNAKAFQEIVNKAELLLVDECDKATDKRYRKLFLKHFKGRYRYGFSGTCFDPAKPVEALVLKEHLGSIIFEIDRKYLEGIGRIIPIRPYMIAIGEDGDKGDRMAYDIAEKEHIVENDTYHKAIKKIIDAFPHDRNLVLVDTNNVEILGKALAEKIEDSVFIYGKTSKKKRNEAIEDFKSGKLRCLIGGKILKRGLDIKGGVHNLIICGGGKLHSDFNQKTGRAVRQNDKGFARLFFFLHLNNYYLYRHSKEQLKSIIAMGYKAKVLVNGQTIDGEQLVKSKFRLPKRK